MYLSTPSRRKSIKMWLLIRLVALLLILLPPSVAWAQPSPPGQVIHVNGIDLHYVDRGKGEPLLLVHGFGGCGGARQLGSIADALAQDYRLIIPDLRGHGWSTGAASSFTTLNASEDIAALLNSLGLRRVRAIGLSAGGMVLLHLAAREPDRISSMVLVGTAQRIPDQTRAIARGMTMGTLAGPARELWQSCAVRGENQMRGLVDRFRSFVGNNTDDVNFSAARLSTIRARTLIVHGDRDRLFPVEIPFEMYRGIPNSELWIVPGGDHIPIWGDTKPEFLRVTREFLNRQP
jgi:pimeloyl-ACP methyl ester carboxylesterase